MKLKAVEKYEGWAIVIDRPENHGFDKTEGTIATEINHGFDAGEKMAKRLADCYNVLKGIENPKEFIDHVKIHINSLESTSLKQGERIAELEEALLEQIQINEAYNHVSRLDELNDQVWINLRDMSVSAIEKAKSLLK